MQHRQTIKLITFCNYYLYYNVFLLSIIHFMSQYSTTRATAMSSCARTDSVSPSTLCVTMTTTAATAPMSRWSVVSGHLLSLMGELCHSDKDLTFWLTVMLFLCHRVSNVWTRRVPLCQWPLPHPELVGVWRRLRLPRPLRRSPQEPTLLWSRLEAHFVFNLNFIYIKYIIDTYIIQY